MDQLKDILNFTEMFCLAGCEDQIRYVLMKNPELKGMLIVIDTRTGEEMTLDLNHANEPSVKIGNSRYLLLERAQHLVFAEESLVHFVPVNKYKAPTKLETGAATTVNKAQIRPARTLLFMTDGLKAVQNMKEDPALKPKIYARLNDGRTVELVLNLAGVAGYIDGTSIKLLPQDATLTEESDLMIEALLANSTLTLSDMQDIDALRREVINQQLRAIYGGASFPDSNSIPDLAVKEAESGIVFVSVATFNVDYGDLPKGNFDAQGRIYYKAALNSIENRRREIEAGGQKALRIETIGNIVPTEQVIKAFEKRLVSNGSLSFEIVSSGQTFQKYVVARDYKIRP